MFETLTASTETQTLKKKKQKPNYFDITEETAVICYLDAESKEEKDIIYNTYLKQPLDKMISSIIRRYKLYRKEIDFEELHNDTHSFLMTKIDKFKPSKDKKAYSYFGTICKNYLMGQIMKDQKETNRRVSYEDISSSLEDRPDMVYTIDNETINPEDIIKEYTKVLKDFIESEKLNENEIKLGYALIDLFDNYKKIFMASPNNKFNKNIVLLSLREMTNLNTKEIRTALKKFKTLYKFTENGFLD